MKNRPLIFNILCVIMLLEPLLKIITFKLSTGFAWDVVFNNIMQLEGAKNFFEFWLLFPLGAVALIKIRKWSYALFIAVQLYSLITILLYRSYTWPYLSKTPLLSTIIVLGLNISLIIYFLLPDIRRPFFDKKERWWEPKTRFKCQIAAVVNFGEAHPIYNCTIHNISQTGLFLSGPAELMQKNLITIDFKLLDENFSLQAEIISRHKTDEIDGHGVKFKYRGIRDYLAVRKVVTHFELSAMS